MSALGGLRVRLSLALAFVVAVALAVVYVIVVPPLERSLTEARLDDLEAAIATLPPPPPADSPRLADYVAAARDQTAATRVVFLAPLSRSREVLVPRADSLEQRPSGDVADDRVAIEAATTLQPQRGTVSRGGRRYAELAVPVVGGSVLLFAAALDEAAANVQLVQRRLLVAGALALVVAVLLGAGGASLFAQRLRRLERAAHRIASGRLDEPVTDTGADEVAQLAAAFEHMRRRLARLEHARREFVANASHELRTPIFSLGGFLELLASEELDEATRREFLTSMQEQVERLTRLAADLLDLSRLDAGQLRAERVPVDLPALAETLRDEFSVLAQASGHTLEVVAEGDVAPALADGERVHRIGRALVENALRHTPPGTAVRIRVTGEGDASVLAVEDEGPGIPAEHAEHVFDRFYRVDGARASGSGLGLAIARELAELMGGELELASASGRTAFRLVLPVLSPRQPAAVAVP